MRAPINVAIIGAGGIAQAHFEGYRQAGANVVAFADLSEVTRQLRREQWQARGYATFEELLDHESVQAISICTPNAFHAPVALMALERGIHVLCEKPLSLSLEDCDRMIEAAHRHGLVLQTGHHLRSNLFVETAKRLIDEGRIGRLTFLRLRQAHDWGGAEEVRGAFGSLAASGGGTLLDNGCHMMDLARHFAGEVVSVAARMKTLKFDVEVEDTSVVTLEFENGALASIENAWTATGWEESFSVYGTKGALECSNRLGEPKLRFLHRESGPGHQDTTWYEFGHQGAHQRGVGRFVRSITEGAPVVCSGEDGRESVRLILGAYESARTGRFIPLSTPSLSWQATTPQ
ncbi:Gfo/Idh/MocA family protein [Deinococcus peraridilitoris]|uniref:Putative dehydrogenase n=1 Tax=Deinococcus peraridilitoris (strain DSM 19664 / LMG 22246 / CIP 109416 / KR-200) TaxID=937777 RepID=L0A5I3_DEIPD|nr:Gfo/Idh/MocA family oxidoreductase [Deinococcus peraridilitoris]AFZ68280.1 putative dehydrogenase [Deinococcus peraridilitoris DSM 19664]